MGGIIMKPEEFKNTAVKDQSGEPVIIIEIKADFAKCSTMGERRLYHTSKLFYRGKPVQGWLSKEND
jgi:hypothetical protein